MNSVSCRNGILRNLGVGDKDSLREVVSRKWHGRWWQANCIFLSYIFRVFGL